MLAEKNNLGQSLSVHLFDMVVNWTVKEFPATNYLYTDYAVGIPHRLMNYSILARICVRF